MLITNEQADKNRFFDPVSCRVWRVLSWHPARPERRHEGIRARIADDRNVVSVVPQVHFERLIAGHRPSGWDGVAADEIDAATDLYVHETAMREPDGTPGHLEIHRTFRYQEGLEFEELWVACSDPYERLETNFHTLLRRWIRVERLLVSPVVASPRLPRRSVA